MSSFRPLERCTQPRARRPKRAQILSIVVKIVKDVRIHVSINSVPPTDSSGGNGLGGSTADIETVLDRREGK